MRWLPLIVASVGAGVLVIGVADVHSRANLPTALPLFWLGILAIVGPAAWRLFSETRGSSRPDVGRVATGDVAADLAGRVVTVSGRVVRRPRSGSDPVRVLVDDGSGPAALRLDPGRFESADLRSRPWIEATGIARRAPRSSRGRPRLEVEVVAREGVRITAAPPAPGSLRGLLRRRPARAVPRPQPSQGVVQGATRNERLAIVVVLGLGLYAVKLMTNPIEFGLPDEFTHWRTLEDILRSGHLFVDNPLLRISAIYPGLEAAVATGSVSSGLPAFPLAMLVIAVTRAMTMLAVFLIAERVTGSPRVAGIATLIYAANASFLIFDAAFSYESLALPLALLALWAILRWQGHGGRSSFHAAIAFIAIAATSVTHHLTSLAVLVCLVAWAAISLIRERPRRRSAPVVIAAIWALACSATWLVVAGTLAISYLTFIVRGGVEELLGILQGVGEAKRLFTSRAGFAAPPAEVVVAYASTGLVLLSLPLMLLHAVRSRRPTPITLVLAGAAALFPAALALRFTVSGSETSQRASEFVFLGIGILGADWLAGRRAWRWRPSRRGFVVPLVVMAIAGGIVTGAPPIGRLPGPYHVAAEQRSFEAEGRAAATWSLRQLGPDNRVIADRTNGKLFGSAGLQYPVTTSNQRVGTAFVMFSTSLGPGQLDILRRGQIRYVVVDLRLSQDVPVYPFYFESSEPNAGNHTTPIPREALEKFDRLPGVNRIYDSGNITIYDIGGLVDGGS